MTQWAIFIVLFAICSVMVGCHQHVYSPPARTALLEPVEPAPVGETRASASIAEYGMLFGFVVRGGSVTVRQGVRDDMELGIDINLQSVQESNEDLACCDQPGRRRDSSR